MKCTTPSCTNETPPHRTAKYCKECADKRKKEHTKMRNKRKSDNLRQAFGFKYF